MSPRCGAIGMRPYAYHAWRFRIDLATGLLFTSYPDLLCGHQPTSFVHTMDDANMTWCTGTLAPAWQTDAEGNQAPTDTSACSIALMRPQHAPSTSGEFQRDWRRNCLTPFDKYSYLKLCGQTKLGSIFKVEVTSTLLGEILEVIDRCWPGTAGNIVCSPSVNRTW